MRQFLKFFIALCVAVALVLIVRIFAFTICSAPVAIGKRVVAGEKVMVSKWARYDKITRGDVLLFTVSGEAPRVALIGPPQELGVVTAVPGDTITVKAHRYRIPFKCCVRCQCHDCCLYLVDTGNGRRLVHKHQIVGKEIEL